MYDKIKINKIKEGLKLGKFSKISKFVSMNDVKALNKSINDVGRKHHAIYITDMMFSNDVNKSYETLLEVKYTIKTLYNVINQDYLLKKKIADMFKIQTRNMLIIQDYIECLSEKQLFEIIYQQALKYYFKIDIKNESCFESFFNEAVLHRITSNFLQNEVECLLFKIKEDIEIINIEINNLMFLKQNYEKLDKSNTKYNSILLCLTELMQNTLLYDGKFNENYFNVVKKMNNIINTMKDFQLEEG